jgi:hypothetical protein
MSMLVVVLTCTRPLPLLVPSLPSAVVFVDRLRESRTGVRRAAIVHVCGMCCGSHMSEELSASLDGEWSKFDSGVLAR